MRQPSGQTSGEKIISIEDARKNKIEIGLDELHTANTNIYRHQSFDDYDLTNSENILTGRRSSLHRELHGKYPNILETKLWRRSQKLFKDN